MAFEVKFKCTSKTYIPRSNEYFEERTQSKLNITSAVFSSSFALLSSLSFGDSGVFGDFFVH